MPKVPKENLSTLRTFLENDELDETSLNEACDVLLNFESTQQNEIHFLNALGALLYARSTRLKKIDRILGENGVLAEFLTSTSAATCLAAVKCVRNCCIRSKSGDFINLEHQSWCFEKLVHVLQNNIITDDSFYHKIAFAIFTGLKNLLSAPFRPPKTLLPALFGAIKVHMSIGLPGHKPILPYVLYVSGTGGGGSLEQNQATAPILRKQRKGKPCKQKRMLAKQQSDGSGSENEASTSSDSSLSTPPKSFSFRPTWAKRTESDSSDSEMKTGHSVEKTGHIRLFIMESLELMLRLCDKSLLQLFWLSFFPDPEPSYFGPKSSGAMSVCHLLLKEPIPKVRSAILAVFNSWGASCKLYLASADDRRERSTFTSLSQVIAGSLTDLHKTLLLALATERQAMNVAHVLKSCSLLLSLTPYKRLKSQLFPNMVNIIRSYVNHRDANVRVAVFGCFSSALICCNEKQNIENALLEKSENDIPWLWKCCENAILPSNGQISPIPVRLEALQTATRLLKTFPLNQSLYNLPLNLSKRLYSENDWDIKLHSTRLVKACVLAADQFPENLWREILEESDPFAFATKENGQICKQMRQIYIEWCHLIAHLPEKIFVQLNPQTQQAITDRLVGLGNLREQNTARLQSSAFNALGNVATFSKFEDPLSIILDFLKRIEDLNRAAGEKLLRALCIFLEKRAINVLTNANRWKWLYGLAVDQIENDSLSNVAHCHSFKLTQLLVENQSLVAVSRDEILEAYSALSKISQQNNENKRNALDLARAAAFYANFEVAMQVFEPQVSSFVNSWCQLCSQMASQAKYTEVVVLSKALKVGTSSCERQTLADLLDNLCETQACLTKNLDTDYGNLEMLTSALEQVQQTVNAWVDFLAT